GARPWRRFVGVTLPRLAPAILAAALLAFLFGFTAFGTVLLLLDDPVKGATLEVAIYHVGIREFDLAAAATLALEQLGVTFTVARSRRGAAWDAAWMLPLGTSAVTLGLGYLLLPVGKLRTSALLLVLAHALIAFPFVVRALVGPLRARDPALGEAAATLGARP